MENAVEAVFRELTSTPEGHPEFTHGVKIAVWDHFIEGSKNFRRMDNEALRREREHIDEAFGTAWWVSDVYFKTSDVKLLTYLRLRSE